MALRLGSNIASLMAQRRLAEGSARLGNTLERLSSGLRINRAGDDAAGLAIAMSLNADARIFSQAIRNVNDGISMLAIAEGALKSLSDITTRQKELAEQAANGSYSVVQRRALTAEANALVDEFNRVVATTKFNGRTLLNGSGQEISLQAGSGANSTLQFNLGKELERETGTGAFLQQVTVLTAGYALGDVLTGDFNSDGIADIVFTSEGGSSAVTVLIGNGDGTFRAQPSLVAANAGAIVTVGDVNNDGHQDIIALDGATIQNIFLGNGDGSFLARRTYEGAGNFEQTVGDVNGDGNLDVITSSYLNGVSVMLGNGDGSFRRRALTSTGSSGDKRVAIGDVNGDGKDDIVVSGYGSDVLHIFLGSSSGNLVGSQTITVGDQPRDVRFYDVNFDGYLDLINLEQTSGNINIFLGNGNGTFQAPSTYANGIPNAAFFDLGDFNGDGVIDLVNSRSGSSSSVLLGNKDGSFQAPRVYIGIGNNGDVSVADFNGDGALDATIRHNDGAGSLSIYFGTPQKVTSMPYLNLSSQEGALAALDVISNTQDRVLLELGSIGANQSRLDVSLNMLAASRENYYAAESRITSADIAHESAELARLTILQQSAAAILAQANQAPALVLTLLKS